MSSLTLPVLAGASLGTWIHVGACVVLPLAWGLATEYFFRWLDKRRAGGGSAPKSDSSGH